MRFRVIPDQKSRGQSTAAPRVESRRVASRHHIPTTIYGARLDPLAVFEQFTDFLRSSNMKHFIQVINPNPLQIQPFKNIQLK